MKASRTLPVESCPAAILLRPYSWFVLTKGPCALLRTLSVMNKLDSAAPDAANELRAGVDYYVERGLVVFTAEYLLKRGWCCGNGCRHCPFECEPQSELRQNAIE